MIFVPEYAGVCSCRIGPPPTVYTTKALSGDQLTPPMCFSLVTSFDSRPSAAERTHSSLMDPLAVRTKAERLPSGEATASISADAPAAPRPRPPPAAGAPGTCRGGRPSRSDTYRADTPARSHVNVT